MSAPEKVLVAGLGYVGRELFQRLEHTAHEAWGVRRSAKETHPRILAADVSTGGGLEALPADISQIAIAVSPDSRTDEAYEAAYPQTIRTLTRQFPRARLLLVGSTTVYAQRGSAILDEQSPADAETFTAKRILEAEALVLDHGRGSCVLRASGIYGPTRTRMVTRLASEPLGPEESEAWTNRIHRDDLAGALGFLIHQQSLDGIFVASDPNPTKLGAIAEWVRSQPKSKQLGSPDSVKKPSRARVSRRFHPTRLLAEGFSFRYPSFKEGYAETFDQL